MADPQQALTSFVPPIIIRRFTNDPEPIREAAADRAEAVTRILSDYLGRLIDHITTHGGEVVKFAGDALVGM